MENHPKGHRGSIKSRHRRINALLLQIIISGSRKEGESHRFSQRGIYAEIRREILQGQTMAGHQRGL